MKIAGVLRMLSVGVTLSACRSQVADGPPPPARYELVVAPPGARGARAAGTDAAPPQLGEQPGAVEPDEGPDPDDALDAGSPSDAGALSPDADGGVNL